MVEVTSRLAYKQIIEEGTAKTQKHKIFLSKFLISRNFIALALVKIIPL